MSPTCRAFGTSGGFFLVFFGGGTFLFTKCLENKTIEIIYNFGLDQKYDSSGVSRNGLSLGYSERDTSTVQADLGSNPINSNQFFTFLS